MFKQGDTVIVISGTPNIWNSHDTAPAIVTMTWGGLAANLKVFPDFGTIVDLGSVGVYADEASARGILAAIPEGQRPSAFVAYARS